MVSAAEDARGRGAQGWRGDGPPAGGEKLFRTGKVSRARIGRPRAGGASVYSVTRRVALF